MPFSNSSSDNFHLPEKIHHPLSHDFRLLDTREMRRIFDRTELRAGPSCGVVAISSAVPQNEQSIRNSASDI
jgi:hypothetical protein